MHILRLMVITLLLWGCTPTDHLQPSDSSGSDAPTGAILQLDTQGHTAKIWDIIVTQSGDIVSASDDKTIRVWDSTTGKETRKILGQIGAGDEGKIYAIALSPDEQFLAVGGYFKNDEIRIYNYQTGTLHTVLKSHTDVVFDLAFSPDGVYLISGSADTTAKIWRTKDFSLSDTIRFHTDHVYAVNIIQKGGKHFALTAGLDNQIALYNMQRQTIEHHDTKGYKLQYLATSPKHIAVCGLNSNEIQIYDHALQPIQTIRSETEPAGLAYSPNGEFLIAGTATSPRNVNIYSVKEAYRKHQSFQKHSNLTQAVAFLDNQRAISAGGNNKEIYIWERASGRVREKIEGVGAVVWSVGIQGEQLAWGNEWTASKGKSKLQKTLNLKTLAITETPTVNRETFKRIATTQGNLTLSHRAGGAYGYSDAVLELKQKGKLLSSITRGATNGYRHRCYGFYRDYIISGGNNGHLKIYNLQGQEIANLVGHTAEVWSIALEGDRLVSGSSDQTIKIWDLSKLQRSMQPQATLFVSKTNEWVLWTPEGFFDASEEGAKYIGYHLNYGAEQAAKFVSVDRLYRDFYRSGLVQKSLAGEDLSRYAKAINIGKILKDGYAPKVTLPKLPKEVEGDLFDLKLGIANRSGGVGDIYIYRAGKLVATKNSLLKKVGNDYYFKLDLEEGNNHFNVIVYNQKNSIASKDNYFDVFAKTTAHHGKRKLYILGIGIEEFEKESLELKYAVNDVQHLSQALQKHSEELFSDINVTLLISKEQTNKQSIEEAFTKLAKVIKPHDYFLVHFSSHGDSILVDKDAEKTEYFLYTSDVLFDDRTELEKTSLSSNDLINLIGQITSKRKIVILDTCYSGDAAGKLSSSLFKSSDDGIKQSIEWLNIATGSVIFASSTSDKKSIEHEGNGLFTHYLVKGIMGEATEDDNFVSISELKTYTQMKVYQEAKRRYNYEQIPRILMDTTIDYDISQR